LKEQPNGECRAAISRKRNKVFFADLAKGLFYPRATIPKHILWATGKFDFPHPQA
jgi:hypothetical protein